MKGLRTWMEVDTSAIKQNYNILRKIIEPSCLLMAVVKSNAYGHGLVDFSRTLQKAGVDWFGVDSITEAVALRKNGIKKPILVLGYTLPGNINEAIKNNISLTVSSFAALRNFKKPVKIHLKIDTGMHRQGVSLAEVPHIVQFLKKQSSTTLEGTYTHFAAAGNPAYPKETKKQIELFQKAINIVHKKGFNPLRHTAATSAIINFKHSHFDMVRAGIGLYGLWPSKETALNASRSKIFRPVLSWKTIVSEVKNLPRGEKIGYELTEKITKDSTIAICPVGYWHGYPRNLSRIGNVLVRSKRAKVLGRVSMDMIAVDVSNHKNVEPGDVVTLIGRDGKEKISADELAHLTETINYEIVTRINPLIKKFYR